MKYTRTLSFSALALGAILGLSAWLAPDAVTELQIGDPVPMMAKTMLDAQSDREMSLRELNQKNGLLVIFSCNTCPFVMQWEDRYNDLYEQCRANQIGMVLINSNEAKRAGDDSIERMKQKAMDQGYKMPYLVDENHELADAFGARTTPHVFLFNQHASLAYRGAIDDNSENRDAVTKPYLRNAIDKMVEGQVIDPQMTKSIGCSIKRVKS